MGREALKAVLGEERSIEAWRGSTIDTPLGKVIPTIHPAAILRKWDYRPAVVNDLAKAADESEFSEIRRTKRELVINPSYEEVLSEINRIKNSEWVAFDIEVETEQITCISLSDRRDWAICIPFWFGASGSLWNEEQETTIWKALRDLLEGESPRKIAHNGSYDVEYLWSTMGIRTKLGFDTMLGFHTLYPELPKALSYLVSIYTDHPYYKYQLNADTMDEYWAYNATDSCVTFECFEHIYRELRDSNQLDFYYEYVHALVSPLLDMQLRGIRFDSEARNRARKQYRYELSKLAHTLEEQVGHPLNVASHPQMTKWLYEELGLPKITKKRKDTGARTLAADEEALNELYKKHEVPAIKTILEIRERSKILSTYLDVKLDADKRIRCSYLITGTETGRLSSRSTSRRTGTNLQNIPPGIVRRLFLADEGKILVNADLSQAEARVVAYLSGEERLIRVFEEGGDIHKKNAANIFGKEEKEITDKERQMAKRVVHASNYGMGPQTFARTADIALSDAKRLLNQYFATYPRIRIWHMDIKAQLKRTRMLVTPLGRKRTFFNRWSESVVKEGLAFIPQSTVADIVNQGLIEAHQRGLELLTQVHDSIMIQCKESNLQGNIEVLRKCLTRPIEIGGKVLTIPVDFKVGSNWEDMKELST
jgi:DNA polymerase-1